MSWKHESYEWEKLAESMLEIERVAKLVANTQPTWSGHLLRVVQAIKDGYIVNDSADAERYRWLRDHVECHIDSPTLTVHAGGYMRENAGLDGLIDSMRLPHGERTDG